MQKHVNLVDLVKSFPTNFNIYSQNLASIQKRTSPVKFAHLAEKSENCCALAVGSAGIAAGFGHAGPRANNRLCATAGSLAESRIRRAVQPALCCQPQLRCSRRIRARTKEASEY